MVHIFWFYVSSIFGPEFYFNWKDTSTQLLKQRLNERITQSNEFFLKKNVMLRYMMFLFDQLLTILVFVNKYYNDMINITPNVIIVIYKLELLNR